MQWLCVYSGASTFNKPYPPYLVMQIGNSLFSELVQLKREQSKLLSCFHSREILI